MGIHFITFTPVKGVYKKAIRPYKKWYELAYMSPLIEVDRQYYRILRTTIFPNLEGTRKVVISDETGKRIKSEELTRECLKVMVYLARFQRFNKGLESGSDTSAIPRLDKFITELKKTLPKLESKLTNEETEALKYQLHYYEEMKRYTRLIAENASQLLTYAKPLEKNEIKVFSTSFTKELVALIDTWEMYKTYARVFMIEGGFKGRDTVKRILKNKDYARHFSNQETLTKMIKEINEANNTSKRIINDGKFAWEREVQWLHPDKGKFDLNRYLGEQRNRDEAKVFLEVNTNEIIRGHWVYSPNYMY